MRADWSILVLGSEHPNTEISRSEYHEISRSDFHDLGACYIRTKVTKCIREKMTLYFRG